MTVHTPTNTSVLSGHRLTVARVALYLGALAVLLTGVTHIQQYYGNDYSTIPTIGTLFFLNFVASVVVAIGLVAPIGHIAGRFAELVRAAFAVSGISIAVLSLVALFVSEATPLFGFQEHGYRMAIVLAIIAEVAAAVLLTIFLVAEIPRLRGRSE